MGKTDLVQHKIELEDETPFKKPYRRIPPNMLEEVREYVKEMLNSGVIRESNSNCCVCPQIRRISSLLHLRETQKRKTIALFYRVLMTLSIL